MVINNALFSSNSDDWETPRDFFKELNAEFKFTLDPCATKETAKCAKYFTKAQDGLKQPWVGRIYCNPPYGREVRKWVEKARLEVLRGNAEIVVMLLPARTDVKWFHEHIYGIAELRFIKGRLRFEGAESSAPFPSMLAIFKGGDSGWKAQSS